jgi:hypothetical protein
LTAFGRIGCAASLRQGVYWIGEAGSTTQAVHNATDGDQLPSIDVAVYGQQLEITADRRFLLLSDQGTDDQLVTVDTHTKMKVDTSSHDATHVSVCDDGTIISSDYWSGALLATYSIDGTGQLDELSAVDVGPISTTVCSPGSAFVVAVTSQAAEVRSFAVSPSLNGLAVHSLTLSSQIASLAFNSANSDLFVLQIYGELSVYAFDSNTGMFGALQASVDTGNDYFGSADVTALQFAYGKLFVRANDQLWVFDGELNLLSSDPIISGYKAGICISEGVMCC